MIRRFLRHLTGDHAWYGLVTAALATAALALIVLSITAWSTRDD
ncbi:hypothetical protein ACPC54_23920 [Kitasatospora sp. NPDC094028]